MLGVSARSQTIVARKQTGTAVIYTDPQPVGDANFCQATLNVAVLFSQNLGTATLEVEAWGANDGVNWFPISGISFSVTGTGLSEDGDYVTCAFIRFKISLSTDAANADDLAVATFDLHTNLTRK